MTYQHLGILPVTVVDSRRFLPLAYTLVKDKKYVNFDSQGFLALVYTWVEVFLSFMLEIITRNLPKNIIPHLNQTLQRGSKAPPITKNRVKVD